MSVIQQPSVTRDLTSTGNILYETSLGKASLKKGRDEAFTSSTVAAIASMSKLLTSVAVLKAVELGILDLDADLRPLLPTMGQYGIMTGFDQETFTASFATDSTPITMRMLLCHTSGHEYDWLNPLLAQWRFARSEDLWSGPTVEDKSSLPLLYKPGTSFSYGGGSDWAGKVIQVASGKNLDEFLREHIWTKLGIQDDISFYPKQNESMARRLADLSTLDGKGLPPAEESDFDILHGGRDCLGGGGCFSTRDAYFTFLSAVFRRDTRLLSSASYEELFRPQLDENLEQAFNDYLYSSPEKAMFLTQGIPAEIRKNWSLAGMICLDGVKGRFGKNTVLWGGVPCMNWWMDPENEVCGTAFCQIIPPMHPGVMALHEQFQRCVVEIKSTKNKL